MSNQNQSGNERGGSGNFAHDPERASEAGKKGGQQSQSGSKSGTHHDEKSGGHEKSGGQMGGSDRKGTQQGGSRGSEESARGGSTNK